MKLTAFKGQVVSLGRPRASDRHTKDNVVLDSEDGETFYLTLSPEKLRALHVGQTVVVSFETEEPVEAPADIPAKATRVPEGQQEERVAELEALLTRIVKYAREDRAETPGVTRLARALAEAEKVLARPDGGES